MTHKINLWFHYQQHPFVIAKTVETVILELLLHYFPWPLLWIETFDESILWEFQQNLNEIFKPLWKGERTDEQRQKVKKKNNNNNKTKLNSHLSSLIFTVKKTHKSEDIIVSLYLVLPADEHNNASCNYKQPTFLLFKVHSNTLRQHLLLNPSHGLRIPLHHHLLHMYTSLSNCGQDSRFVAMIELRDALLTYRRE